MTTVILAAMAVFLAAGLFFALAGTVGILRMPDVYGRLQASTCIATLSTFCAAAAGILYAVHTGMSAGTVVKLVLLVLLILCTNPIANHALCKAAYRIGIRPARDFVIDDYREDFGEQAYTEVTADLPDEQFDRANEPIPAEEEGEIVPEGGEQ
ncbi:monovalent cation/H(+) antiporter subunit G [Lachnoclostridium sp. Marseille-P6806]|uniref:monovalent cation/H(+) antiporter subunit G n=1 Tax=Lachnoclostridium sp. Marseille-P6806 TaxID=2364793 RepID=UPI0010306F4C|nr:monovalent cation/H(+) antiporter subunit G [Lachnoclostridium sp. Marseille-P6806]